MTLKVFQLAARRIPYLALALIPVLAAQPICAQSSQTAPYGYHQSPIDIIQAGRDLRPLEFGDTTALNQELTLTLRNTTGKKWCKECGDSTVDQRWGSLKASPPEGRKIKIWYGQQSYTLLEFHFHSPAEHLVNGRLAEMEAHYVFKKDDGPSCATGALLVLAQRIKVSKENKPNDMLNKIFGGMTLPVNYDSGPKYVEGFNINDVLGDLHKQSSYRYPGSLTAPSNDLECPDPPGNPNQQLASGFLPEVVSWVVLVPEIEMSEEQIARFQKLFPNGDARGPQTLHPKVRRVALALPPTAK
ncbi:MAG TPA: carbonic anhydrase family protein [Terracidiphilus sp.]|jgi:carbonic anhydrase